MQDVNFADFSRNLCRFLEAAARGGEPLCIHTEAGNAVLLSAEAYGGLLETVYLSAQPGMAAALRRGLQTPLADCLAESEVEW